MAWGTATSLLRVLCAIQAVVSICGSGPGCWEVCVQQSEFLASLSAHVHAGDVLTHVRELLGGVCVTPCIFALELYHYSSYYTQVSLARPIHSGGNRDKILSSESKPVCEGREYCS